MTKTTIVYLDSVKEMLAELDKARREILRGRNVGFHTTLMGEDSSETIFLGGAYRDDPKRALGAILKTSAARAKAEDPPLPKLA